VELCVPAVITSFSPFPAALPAHMSEQMTCHQYAIKRFAGYATLYCKFQNLKSIFGLNGTYMQLLFTPVVCIFVPA
jgi:hypothetical protein